MKIFTFLTLFCVPIICISGSANIQLNCLSFDKKATIVGNVPGDIDEYNLTISMGTKSIKYIHECANLTCDKMSKTKRTLRVVNAINEGIFVISFSDDGYLYAFPNTIKIKKLPHGYGATYRAIYFGIDPRKINNESHDTFLRKPIKFRCSHKYEI
jgi:hypothetical protein